MHLFSSLCKKLMFILLSLVIAGTAGAETSLWKISKNNRYLLLGGTIHLMSEADYPLPPAYEAAYKAADILVLETDLDAAKSLEFQANLLQTMRYENGASLRDKLTPEVFTLLADYLSSHRIPIERLQQFKPGMIAVTVTMVEMQRLGMAGTGVDAFYNAKAAKDQKERLYLETPEQQIKHLAKMGEGRENELIRYTLEDLEQMPDFLKPMKLAWRNGDTQTLEAIALTPWKHDFPGTYKNLLVQRNKAWYPQIRKMLKTEPVELVLVGALHLVGTDGILAQLKRHGYDVTPYSAGPDSQPTATP